MQPGNAAALPLARNAATLSFCQVSRSLRIAIAILVSNCTRKSRKSVEHPLAALVHDLARLGERELDRVVVGGMAVRADELVLLRHAADLLGDAAGGLVLPLGLVGRGADREAVVVDRLARLLGG